MSHLKLSTIFVLTVACYYLGVTEVSCPNGWIQRGADCYGFGTTRLTWPEAMAVCLGYGGRLAEVQTDEIRQWIKAQLITRQIATPIWIGGNDIFRENEWKWVSDSSDVDRGNFRNGQPDNYKRREDCLEMGEWWHYMWNDNNCLGRNYFVCQIRNVVRG